MHCAALYSFQPLFAIGKRIEPNTLSSPLEWGDEVIQGTTLPEAEMSQRVARQYWDHDHRAVLNIYSPDFLYADVLRLTMPPLAAEYSGRAKEKGEAASIFLEA